VDVGARDRPVFLIGDDAAYRGLLKPECCLRSVKRKFQFWEEAFVMDEQGRSQRYRLEELVKFLLLRLVALAEDTEGREITKLGLTFPTKWPPRVRTKLKGGSWSASRKSTRPTPSP
jgi:molecular chaperone DnaK (HSP70)